MRLPHLPWVLPAMGCLLLPGALHAAPLNLAQSPVVPGRDPAPNVIVSVDDSASMGAAGIDTLKAALRQTFSSANVADDRVRLAWQSMNRCRGIPSPDTACRGRNGMARLSGTHRADFMNWVGTLRHEGGTPSHLLIDGAGQYLSRTDLGVKSPWAANPGEVEAPVLSCRKAFHIFMTDGAWNSAGDPLSHVDTAGPNGERIVRAGNADNTSIVLPDGVHYDATSAQTQLYRDEWGSERLSTLSDLTFYYWSRDLQPQLENKVQPSPRTPWPRQNFGTTERPAELDAYWNPRNDPATWQHMVTYTIGFNSAAQWTGLPTWTGDTSGQLTDLIARPDRDRNGKADEGWPSPFCDDTVDKSSGMFGKGNLPCDGQAGYRARENERKVELWHAALNSRGRFVPASSASALTEAFKGILDDILDQTVQQLVSIASSASRLRTDGLLYLAGYDSARWSGSLSAYRITATTHDISDTPTWSAHGLLDAPTLDVNLRNILTHDGHGGVPFQWDHLNPEQRKSLQGQDTEPHGQQRLRYLRGHRGDEVDRPGGSLRRRDSRLGDIVNANIWQTGRPARLGFEHPGHAAFRADHANRKPVLYVGANDGMLHAFDAEQGRELMAYVPQGLYTHLEGYTRPGYRHRYFVDGQAFTGDADMGGHGTPGGDVPVEWHTLLVGSLGGGGRGYFVLDVTRPLVSTDPASTFKPSGVVLDRTLAANDASTDEADKDIGHIHAPAATQAVDSSRSEQIVKLNNGRWAVVMGNGVNSINERPVLLIQYLDGRRELQRIVAHAATGQANGLSTPRLLDVNSDGQADIAYAGDLQGNLWKFDLIHTDDTKWGVSAWSDGDAPCHDTTTCIPFFVARDGASSANRQPITTVPMWMQHPLGGVQILFGTGRQLEEADRSSTTVQTLYSLWDQSTYALAASSRGTRVLDKAVHRPPISQGRRALVQQTVTGALTSFTSGVETPTPYFNSSRNPVPYSRTDAQAPRGWYLDLPEAGERVLGNPQLFEGQKVIVSTVVPAHGSTEETCEMEKATDKGWVHVLNMITGQPARTPVFSTSDGTISMSQASRAKLGTGEYTGLQWGHSGDLELLSLNPDCGKPGATCAQKRKLTAGNTAGKRADWRETP